MAECAFLGEDSLEIPPGDKGGGVSYVATSPVRRIGNKILCVPGKSPCIVSAYPKFCFFLDQAIRTTPLTHRKQLCRPARGIAGLAFKVN